MWETKFQTAQECMLMGVMNPLTYAKIEAAWKKAIYLYAEECKNIIIDQKQRLTYIFGAGMNKSS